VLLLSPAGRRLDQPLVRELASEPWLVLVCGRYEGVDERVVEGLPAEEISIGDYVLSGGELPALVVLEAVSRLVPGVVGKEESLRRESFEDGVLDHPHYTRPAEFRGMRVPETLLSGDHARIEQWRRRAAEEKTSRNRPDLLGPDA
jgi:tRNA (guanine37-N1)-methyltransferase